MRLVLRARRLLRHQQRQLGAGGGATAVDVPAGADRLGHRARRNRARDRALLRTVYARDEAFQLLLTFALVLMFQDVLRFFWGANPQQLGNLVDDYGKLAIGDVLGVDLQPAGDGGEHRDRRRHRRAFCSARASAASCAPPPRIAR